MHDIEKMQVGCRKKYILYIHRTKQAAMLPFILAAPLELSIGNSEEFSIEE